MAQEFLDFLIALAIVIFAAKLGGYISTRFGQPSVIWSLAGRFFMSPSYWPRRLRSWLNWA
jgi:Kef-type K+ transport system membrane component KefB